jgi:hypothetical protein
MTDASSAAAWVFDREDPDAALGAPDEPTAPDLELATVSVRDDVVTMQVTRGELRDPRSLLHVEGRGLFEILRIEPWPGRRTLLVLKRWRDAGAAPGKPGAR